MTAPRQGQIVQYTRLTDEKGAIADTFPAMVVVAGDDDAHTCTLSVHTNDPTFPVVVVPGVPRSLSERVPGTWCWRRRDDGKPIA